MTNSNTKVDTEAAKRKAIDAFRMFILFSVLSVILGFLQMIDYAGAISNSSLRLKFNQIILLKSGMFFLAAIFFMLLAFGIRWKNVSLLWIGNVLGFLVSISVIWFEKLGYDLVSDRILGKAYVIPFAFAIGIIGTILSRKKIEKKNL